MTKLAAEKLRIFAFPQRINGDQLDVNVLLLPTQRLLNAQIPFNSQLNPGSTVDLPLFINANLALEATTISGLSSYPFSGKNALDDEGVKADPIPTKVAFPSNLPALYEGLLAQFELDPDKSVHTKGADEPKADGIRKYLPKSYRTAFNFTTPRTEFAKTDDSYQCAFKKAPKPDPAFKQGPNFVTWGRIIAFCLRQPLLAERMGLLHRILNLPLPHGNYFENGGWIYFNLKSNPTEFDISDPATELKVYAARIPEISQPRQIFATMLFPVKEAPPLPPGQYDILIPETADYDDGFAKIVHAVQPVSANLLSEEPDGIHVQKDAGVRLGWDDEQLLIWQNRQVLADPTTTALNQRIDAPLGVFSYRVDVREKTNPPSDWASLVSLRNRKDLTLGGELIAPALTEQEIGVQVYPAKINADPAGFYWLPSYFTQWYGPSLVCPDEKAARLDASGALANPGGYSDSKIPATGQVGGLYEPLLPLRPELKYGTQYEFRVRLADLTGGGPVLGENKINDSPANSPFRFKRFIAPKQLTVKPKTPLPPDKKFARVFEGHSFEVRRPRLGYPALLFTEMDTGDAFKKLFEDQLSLHKKKKPNHHINDQRAVGFFDPDVDQILVVVELKTLLLDNLASLTKKEAYIPLYTTFRKFPSDPEKPFKLELEYRDANVIDFGNTTDLGDLGISETQINNGSKIVLPRSRDVRITLYPVCSDKPAKPSYFGFNKTQFGEKFVRTGEPTQFFVREDAKDESAFFKLDLESQQLQAIYLQPDPPQVLRPLSFVADLVEGSELEQATLMQRLATQMKVDFKGMTLMGKPGERTHFGCSNRIRHTLAPDDSSLTFATTGDLINHWLCVLSFEIQRDWTWDGLSDEGLTVSRSKHFTREAATLENDVVGEIRLLRTASRLATTKPDRSHTRVVFIDAVEPKKDLTKPTTQTHPFPNTIDLDYTITPSFISSVKPSAATKQSAERKLKVPVTTIPKQVPKIVAAGIALSPYQHNSEYSETAVRERYLWFEFEEPIADPNDTYFARVLAYAPDPLLTFPNLDQANVMQDDPPLAISPELIRVITKDLLNDNAGIDAMQSMMAETADPAHPLVPLSPVHYLLPLPPGLHGESNDLFGFFTYELRVGHTDGIWSTAQGRFGHPTRVSGVQHPAPPLKCLVDRTPKGITTTAQYATAVFSGKDVTSKPPKTEVWCMLYAQVKQADARKNRNILLSELKLEVVSRPEVSVGNLSSKFASKNIVAFNLDAPPTGVSGWTEAQIRQLLDQFNLDYTTGLSVLAVEMMPRYDQYFLPLSTPDTSVHPLSYQLGQYRILRTSRLVAAPEIC